MPDVPQVHDSFADSFRGQCVALEGGRAVVSAPTRLVGGLATGAVFVFDESSSGWGQGAELVSAAPTSGAYFGYSVALAPGRIVAGAPGAFWPLEVAGTVSVLEEAGGWHESAVLSVPGLVAGARFGDSVAVEGDRIVVGAPGASAGGAAYVFELQQGQWAQTAVLTPSQPEDGDVFGESVALEGSRIVVGAMGDRHTDGARRGAVYVFDLVGGAWTLNTRLGPTAPYGSLGTSVGLAGSTIVGGAPFGTGWAPYPSAVFVWSETGGVWSQDELLHPTTGNDFFGQSLSLSAERLVVGAPSGPRTVYMYERSASGWGEPDTRQRSDAFGFGNGVAYDGDRALVAVRAEGLPEESSAHLVPFGPLEYDEFCFCPNGGCHNSDPNAGCANETGQGASISACGTTSVARDDLVIITSNTGANTFGILFMGRSQIAPQFFGIGFLCVGDPASLVRFPVQPGGPMGVMSQGPGLVSYSQNQLPAHAHIAAGDTWNFQLWYRDGSACTPGYNASSALSVTFKP